MKLSKEQADFIKTEMGIDIVPEVENPVDKKQWRSIVDEMHEIEIGEIDDETGKISKKGRMAVSISNL